MQPVAFIVSVPLIEPDHVVFNWHVAQTFVAVSAQLRGVTIQWTENDFEITSPPEAASSWGLLRSRRVRRDVDTI